MTYLGYPRLHFAGLFQADVSTVNNDPEHFDTDRFAARFQKAQTATAPNGWWNPRGSGAWRLHNCRVTSALYSDGSLVASPDADPIVGTTLAGADDRVSAKLVDLDPQQQMASQIWGLRLRLSDGDGRAAFVGDFAPTPFTDIWPRYPQGQPDSFFGATYQSVLAAVRWSDDLGSTFLRELRQAGDQLSIKFNVDGMDDNPASPTFTWGRIVGAIGPYVEGEAKHFVAARMLWPSPNAQSPLNPAPCRIDPVTGALFLDLGNSLPTTAAGGPLKDVGPLWLVALPPSGPPVPLASLPSVSGAFYAQQAGIVSLPLGGDQAAAAASCRLAILDGAGALLLSENDNATYLRADDLVFRMSPHPPDNSQRVAIFATRYGLPAADIAIAVQHLDMGGQAKRGPVNQPPVGVPPSALTFPPSVVTGPDGRAELPLAAAPPGNPRGYIDGQVYTVLYGWSDGPSQTFGMPVSVLVWDDYQAPERPTWVADVQPILQQYANLYPVMRDIVDLASYSSVVRYRGMLRRVLELPIEDPNAMPVTRDLSPAKRAMLLRWLGEREPPLFAIDDLANLRRMLQLAIELEHATIPPYLCALFSIKPGRNAEVARLIRGVVTEEMLHMALACNLLNAVGGAPEVAKPAFVPRYPGHLPGGIRPDLTVTLRRCSKDQIRDVFMAIEEPEQLLAVDASIDRAVPERLLGGDEERRIDVRSLDLDHEGKLTQPSGEAIEHLERAYTQVEHEPLTIGWFYQRIARAIVELERSGVDVFVGDPSRQLTPASWPGSPPGRLYKITDKASALLAIHEIVRQGEGTTLTDPSGGRHELAHYFRFREIVEGRQLAKDAEGAWTFKGPPILFDPDGVFPMVDDPDSTALPQQSPAWIAAALFDETYGDLLRSLDRAVNGAPDRLRDAIGLMFSLEVQAHRLMAMPLAPGSPDTAGPDFQPA